MGWAYGDVIVRREIDWGEPSLALPVHVVLDRDDLLVTYIAEHAPISYARGVAWPTATGRHPWWPRPRWLGHGTLMLQRPDEPYAVWLFWAGAERRFDTWYLNLQAPFRRTEIGYDTEDHELDVVAQPDLRYAFKDEDELERWVRDGRYPEVLAQGIRATGQAIAAMLDARDIWWDESLADWTPEPDWYAPAPVPQGWDAVPC